MMARRVLWLIAVLMLLVGCGSSTPPRSRAQAGKLRLVAAADPRAPADVTAAEAASLRNGNAVFAGRMLGLLARDQRTVALSPSSISEAVAMLYAGARGGTASQIAHALDFRLPQARLHPAFNALDQSLAEVDEPGVTLHVADALFAGGAEGFRKQFLALLARYYGAGVHAVDFADAAGARIAINRWVSAHTDGKIPDLLGPQDVNEPTALVLVNALYLHAKWLSPFESQDTSPAPFHTPSATITVPTMHQTARFSYLRGDGYRALELPYVGGRLAFDILLPDPRGLGSLLSRLGSGNPLALLRGLRAQTVRLSLPKLLLRSRIELKAALQALGMRLAFDPAGANLSGIGGGLYAQAVTHEAYLKVDERGTEAAAATAISAATTSAEGWLGRIVVFDVDRPFVFILRDLRTGAILFEGTVYRP